MAKYFTFDELISSAVASARGIDNTPSAEVAARLNVLMDRLLDPVRELWGSPLRVSSGYRCRALNAAVGGAARSQHLRGEAVDITTGSRVGNRRLFQIIPTFIEFDQLIDEQNYKWLHISYREGRNRLQILHL